MGINNLGRYAALATTLATGVAAAGCGESTKNGDGRDSITDASDSDTGGTQDMGFTLADGAINRVLDEGNQEPDIPFWNEDMGPDAADTGNENDADSERDASVFEGIHDAHVQADLAPLPDAAPPAVGTITVDRCDLNEAALPNGVLTRAPGNRTARMINMNEVEARRVAGNTTEITTACFEVTAHLENPDATVPLNALSIWMRGAFSQLPTRIVWGDDLVVAPFSPRNNYDTLQPTGGLVVLQNEVPFRIVVSNELGSSDHGDEFTMNPYLTVDAGALPVNCEENCIAPFTTFNDRNRYELYTQYLFGDEDRVQGIAHGEQDEPVRVGDWTLSTYQFGSYGTLTSFDVGCTDVENGASVAVSGTTDVAVFSPENFNAPETLVSVAFADGLTQNQLPIELFPGDTLEIMPTATLLAIPEDAVSRFQCEVTNINFATQSEVVKYDDQFNIIDWTEGDNKWNVVASGDPLNPDIPPNSTELFCTWGGQRRPSSWGPSSSYLWDGNLDQNFFNDEDGVLQSSFSPLDETTIFSWVCWNRGISPASVTHVQMNFLATDFELPASLLADVDLGQNQIYQQQVAFNPMDNGLRTTVDIDFPEPLVINDVLVMSLKPAPGAVDFPLIDPATPEFFSIARPNLQANLTAVQAIDQDGADAPVVFSTVIQDGVNDWGNPIKSDENVLMSEIGDVDTVPAVVEFAKPWSLVSESSGPRPVVADPDDPDTISNGVRVLRIDVSNLYAAGKLVGLRCANNTGKAELGDSIVEVRVGNHSVFVPPELWNARTFEVVLNPATAVDFYDGNAAESNDINQAERITQLEVIIRGDYTGFNPEGFNVSLIDLQVVEGTTNQPVRMGTDIDLQGRNLTALSEENPLTGPVVVLRAN